TVVIARTTKGKGVSFMENQVAWHYRSPNDAQLAQALGEIADARSRSENSVDGRRTLTDN
ncbi:MAG: hypothetical protein J0M17_01655, partial [Planctomycetes bacterium]|nr:hypothetical protein [Planctomycetota bacterium]